MEPFAGYPHVSRFLPLPVEFAQVAFDVAWRRLAGNAAHGDPSATRWGVGGAAGCLDLGAPEGAKAGRTGYKPWRRAEGMLWAGRCLRPRVRVELALTPWSDSRSELGLTALTGRWPALGLRRQQAYLDAAHEALDLLAAAIDSACSQWADQEVWTFCEGPLPMTARR